MNNINTIINIIAFITSIIITSLLLHKHRQYKRMKKQYEDAISKMDLALKQAILKQKDNDGLSFEDAQQFFWYEFPFDSKIYNKYSNQTNPSVIRDDIKEPPCKYCRWFSPRTRTNEYGAYNGIVLCTNWNTNKDKKINPTFSCFEQIPPNEYVP